MDRGGDRSPHWEQLHGWPQRWDHSLRVSEILSPCPEPGTPLHVGLQHHPMIPKLELGLDADI